MKNLTPELIAKAKEAKSAAELLELAKANNIEITAEEAKTYFGQLNAIGTVSDDELGVVAGGSVFSCPSGDEEDDSSSGVDRITCPHCKGLVSRAFTKCPRCSRTLVFC